MASTAGICDVFKENLFKGDHDFDVDTIRMALYVDAATHSNTTSVYTSTNESSGTGYTAGGFTMAGVSVTRQGANSFIDWSTDPNFPGSTITAASGLIYNDSLTTAIAIAILTWT